MCIKTNRGVVNGLMLILAFSSCFLVDRSPDSKSDAMLIDVAISIVLIMLSLSSIFINNINKELLISYLLLFFAAMIPLSFGRSLNIHWLYLICAIEIIRTDYVPSKSLIRTIASIVFISICFQSYSFKSYDDRPVLSIIDPNYSAYYISIFAIFCLVGKKYVLSLFSMVLAAITISRLFYLEIFLLSTLFLMSRIANLNIKLKPIWLLLIVIFAPVLVALIFIALFDNSSVQYISGYDRLFTFTDQSNFDRSNATLNYIFHVIEYPLTLISGVDINDYTESVFYNSPHTSLYQMSLNYGFPFVAFEILIISMMQKKIFSNDASYFYIYFLIGWIVFLGGVLFGPQIIIVATTLNMIRFKISARA